MPAPDQRVAIVNARVWRGAGAADRPAAVAFGGGRVVAIGEGTEVRRVLGAPHELVDARGGTVVPGFVDAHLHLRAIASARTAIDASGARTAAELCAAVAAAAAGRPAGTWLSLAGIQVADPPDQARLDAAAPAHPVRLRHRSLHAWAFSGRAARALDLDGTVGWRADHDGALSRRMGRVTEPEILRLALAEWSRARLRDGLVALLDASASNGAPELASLAAWRDGGTVRQHVTALTGDPRLASVDGSLPIAGVKIIEPGGADLEPRLRERLREAWLHHATAAVHCPDAETLGAALAATASLGHLARALRVEHASVAPPEWGPLLARSGARVVTHPAFVDAHGDRYLDDDTLSPHEWLYRLRSWREAGVGLAFGSDAPAGPDEPLRAWRAARLRRTAGGRTIGPREALSGEDALAGLTTWAAEACGLDRLGYGRLTAGGVAAAVLLEGDPFAPDAEDLRVAGVMSSEGWIA